MSCQNCGCDLRTDGHIHCATCADQGDLFDLCFVCFADRAESRHHKAHHDYYVLEGLGDKPDRHWSYAEQLRLLDTTMKIGLGSWDSTAKSVKTKSPAECEEEFIRLYNNWSTKVRSDNRSNQVFKMRDNSVWHGKLTEWVVTSTPNEADLPGLLPVRGDFDSEFDENAELAVADLEFTQDDTSQETQLKMDILKAYCDRVSYRSRVKNFVLNRGLCGSVPPVPHSNPMNKALTGTPASLEISQKLAPINRFFESKDKFDLFVAALVAERRICERLAELDSVNSASIKDEVVNEEMATVDASEGQGGVDTGLAKASIAKPINRKGKGASAIQATLDSAKKVSDALSRDDLRAALVDALTNDERLAASSIGVAPELMQLIRKPLHINKYGRTLEFIVE